MSLVPPPPVILTPEQLQQIREEQFHMNDLANRIHAADVMRDIYEQLCIDCLKQKGVYDKKEVLGNLVARFMTGLDFNHLLPLAHAEAKKRGYKGGYRNMGDPTALRKELADLIAGRGVK